MKETLLKYIQEEENNMFCTVCGTENNDAANFCNGCGAELLPIKTVKEDSSELSPVRTVKEEGFTTLVNHRNNESRTILLEVKGREIEVTGTLKYTNEEMDVMSSGKLIPLLQDYLAFATEQEAHLAQINKLESYAKYMLEQKLSSADDAESSLSNSVPIICMVGLILTINLISTVYAAFDASTFSIGTLLSAGAPRVIVVLLMSCFANIRIRKKRRIASVYEKEYKEATCDYEDANQSLNNDY